MHRVSKIFVYILALLMFLSACAKKIDLHDLVTCGSYGVPGMLCRDLRGGTFSSKILEEDQYGRVLFEYTTKSCITNEKETSLVLCQMADSDYVYFYEDVCYDFSEQEISDLKTANDWNCPLDSTKMSRRKVHFTLDGVLNIGDKLDYKEVKSSICAEIDNVSTGQVKELSILDLDYAGNELYFLRTTQDDMYFALVNSNYEAAVLKIDGQLPTQDTIHEFKMENGWHYGFAPDDEA